MSHATSARPFNPSIPMNLRRNPLRATLLLSLVGATALAACSSTVALDNGSSAAPVVCAWAHNTSDASCPAGACPIVLDEELICNDGNLGAAGLRVAPTPDATWLATSSANERMVYRLAGGKEERQEGIPEAFIGSRIWLALGPDGAPQLVADPTGHSPENVGGVTRAVFANGTWTSSVILDSKESLAPISDFEISPSGKPFLWFKDGPSGNVALATSNGQGGWTLDPKVYPCDRYTLDGDGSPMCVTLRYVTGTTFQFHARIGGVDTLIGEPIDLMGNGGRLVLAAPPPQIPSGLLFGAAIVGSDGIRVVRVSKEAQAQVSAVVVIPSSAESCPENASCQTTCHYTGTGLDENALAVGWTDDGTAWLTYIVTDIDQTWDYSVEGGGGSLEQQDGSCFSDRSQDSSKGTLHLVRFSPDGSAPTEVLTMPIARLGASLSATTWGRFIDVRGSGKDLAIGVRTGWFTGGNTVRLLRVDTSKL